MPQLYDPNTTNKNTHGEHKGKKNPPPSTPPPTDTSVGGNQNTITTEALRDKVLTRSNAELTRARTQTVAGQVYLKPVPQFEMPAAVSQGMDTYTRPDVPIPQQYLVALDERASVLNPNLVAQYPGEAAALLTSSVPTETLATLSSRIKEGLDFLSANTSIDATPGFLIPYYLLAFNAPTPERRAQALAFLDNVRAQPADTQVAFLSARQADFGALVADHTAVGVIGAVAFGPPMAALGGVARLGTSAITLPLAAAGTGAEAVGLDEVGDRLKGARDWAIEQSGHLPEYAGQAIRVGTGIPAAFAQIGQVQKDEHGDPIEGRYTPLEAWHHYAWDPAMSGGHAGITTLLMDQAGIDPAEYENVAGLLDMTNDVFGGWFVMQIAGGIKAGRTTPAGTGIVEFGGRTYTSEGVATGAEYARAAQEHNAIQVVKDWLTGKSGGRKVLNRIEDLRVEAVKRNQPVKEYIQDNIKGRMPDGLAEDIAAGSSRADTARAIENYADQIPQNWQFAEAMDQINAADEAIRLQDRGVAPDIRGASFTGFDSPARIAGEIPQDPAYLYHATPPENLGSIRAGGLTTANQEGQVFLAGSGEHARAMAFNPDRTVLLRTSRQGLDAIQRGQEGFGVYEYTVRDAISPSRLEYMGVDGEWYPLEGNVAAIPGIDPTVTDLMAHRAAWQQKLLDMNRRLDNPMYDWPKVSALKGAIHNAPSGPVSTAVSHLFNGLRAMGLDPLKLVNDLSPRDLTLYNWHRADKPAWWQEHNVATMENYLRRARVPDSTIRTLLDDMGRVDKDYMVWRAQVSEALLEGITNRRGVIRTASHIDPVTGKRVWELTPEQKAVVEFTEHDAVDATYAPYDVSAPNPLTGEVIREVHNVLEDPVTHRALPTQLNEIIGHTQLADLETLANAKSLIRAVDTWVQDAPIRGKLWGVARVGANTARFLALGIPRLIMKPLLFITRQVPMGTKIQLDQGMRLIAEGMTPLTRFSKRNLDMFPGGVPLEAGWRGLLPDADTSVLGVLRESGVIEGTPMRVPIPTRNLDLNSPLTAVQATIKEVTGGLHEQLQHVANSDLGRMVALRGSEGTLEYITQHPTSAVAAEVDALTPLIERAGVDIPEFLRRKDEQITQITGGREDLRGAIATGRWHRPRAEGEPTAASITLEDRLHQSGLVRNLEARGRVTGDTALLQEAQRRWEQLDAEIADGIKATQRDPDWIDLSHRDRVADGVAQEWGAGAYEPPSTVYVTRRGVKGYEGTNDIGFLNKWKERAAKANEWLYRGLRPLSAADIALTRKSAFIQHFERTYHTLLEHGYAPERAFAVAQYRAAFLTRDLMYDLSARSSFDRSMKDLFWFSPVIREQLTTWLYNIPSRSYLPIGLVAEVGTAHNFVADLTALGVLRKDKGTGELVATIPWVSEVAGHLIGQPLEFRFDGINPVTPGGTSILPTLSPGMEKILEFTTSHAPEELVPWLKGISRIMTFDQGEPGANFVPNGIQTFLGAFGIHVPYSDQFNPTMWANADRQASVQAMQYAMAELRTEGTLPPAPGAPSEEWDQYRAEVETRAHDYEMGVGITRFIGGLLSPMSVITTPKAAADYYAWREQQGFVWPYTQENYDAIDAYVVEHPEALPYTIGKYGQAEDPMLPDSAPFAEKLSAGDLYPLTDDQWYVKAMVTQGFAAEESRLRMELRKVGMGKDANARLANWGEYTQVTADHLLRLDKWFAANPEVEAYLNEKEDEGIVLSQKERIALEASRNIKELKALGVFKDLSSSDLGIVKGAISQAYEDVAFDKSSDPVSNEVGRYFDKFYDPYKEEINPLYDKVSIAFAGGHDDQAFKLLGQIRSINDKWAAKAAEQGLISPEAFSYGSKTKKDQRTWRLNNLLSSPTSLTNFQQDTVGLPKFQGRDILQGLIEKENASFFTALANPHLTDNQKEALYNAHDATITRLATPFGLKGQTWAKLAVGVPADRLTYTGFGKESFYWNVVVSQARDIIAFANSKNVSYRYASESSGLLARKVEFERRIEFLRDIDPKLDRLFRQLAPAAAAFGEDYQLGVPLYEHIFFGHAANDYNYQDPIVALVGGK